MTFCYECLLVTGSGTVMIAFDTRPSSPGLAEAASAGVRSVGGVAEMIGLLTTPQLHWMVQRRNLSQSWDEASYLEELSNAFETLVADSKSLGMVS